MKNISAHSAKMILQHLVMAVAPNLSQEIKVEPKEIQNFFTLLDYPYTIRSDAITAVGAPSTIGFLMRALYWLYLSVKMLYFNPSLFQIAERSSEMSENEVSPREQADSNPEQRLFKSILAIAKVQLHSFNEPYQLRFSLANQLPLPTDNSLRELLMFEY